MPLPAAADGQHTTPLRTPLNEDALSRFISDAVLGGAPVVPFGKYNGEGRKKTLMTVRQFGHGQSNPTYRLRLDTRIRNDETRRDLVLRCRPPTSSHGSAHDLDREIRAMSMLLGSGIPVPRVLASCREDILGLGGGGTEKSGGERTKFYLMDYISGRIYTDPQMKDMSRAERRGAFEDSVRVLAALHSFEGWRKRGKKQPPKTGLLGSSPASRKTYVSRMIRKLIEVYSVQSRVCCPFR